jgi:hypothetical protein
MTITHEKELYFWALFALWGSNLPVSASDPVDQSLDSEHLESNLPVSAKVNRVELEKDWKFDDKKRTITSRKTFSNGYNWTERL